MRHLLLALLTLGLASCAHIRTKSHTFTNTTPATLNGAEITTELSPQGGTPGLSLSAMVYTAGSATLKGPFKWRILATGTPDKHTSLTIHSVRVRTSLTKRKNTFPADQLPPDATFLPYAKTPGKSYAVTEFPGLLEIDPAIDGTTTMTADITVRTNTSAKRKTITFTLTKKDEKNTQFLFFLKEIADSFGPKDPRQWNWSNNW